MTHSSGEPVSGTGFAAASSVHREDPGRYTADLIGGWDILGRTNGGYLLATAARAMADATERDAPITITGHFLSPASAGPVEVETQCLKSGKRLATASATISSASGPLVTVLGSFGSQSPTPQALLADGDPPELPDPAAAVRLRKGPGADDQTMPPPFMDRIDLRLHPKDAGFATGRTSGVPVMRAWFRLLDDEPIDAFGLILAADCLPPTIFNSGLPIGWTPTVELTVHIRSDPSPGWLRLDYRTRFINDGLLEVDGLIWDERDRLVAQSRQLALVPTS